jgi:hypothetical protein
VTLTSITDRLIFIAEAWFTLASLGYHTHSQTSLAAAPVAQLWELVALTDAASIIPARDPFP